MQDVTLDTLESFTCPLCRAGFTSPFPEAFSRTTCPHCGKDITVPGKFGPFLLYHVQSESVTSSMFDAFDPKLDRNVTLKILNYVLSKNQELVESFKREALAAASLNSIYVLKVYEFGIHNRQPFMVMEHIEGKFLHEVMQNETLTEARILDFVQGIVYGLKDMHEQGITHGDVMPRNILIHTDHTPRICDFGLARFNGEPTRQQPQRDTWSSPYYMPPERILGETEDFRGDFYSLGTTLFSMLTGQLPFFDLDEEQVLKRKTEEEAPDPREIKPDISEGLAELTNRLLQCRPENRPSDYEEMNGLLHEIRSRMPRRQREIPQTDTVPVYHAKPNRTKESVGWFVLLVLTGIVLAMLISIPEKRRQKAVPASTPEPAPTATPAPPTPTPTATPAPTPAPQPTATPDPVRTPPARTGLVSPTQIPDILLQLDPAAASVSGDGRVTSWSDPQNLQFSFLQETPGLQPVVDSRPPLPPVLKLTGKRMASSLPLHSKPEFTLVTISRHDPTASSASEQVLLGIHPLASDSRTFRIYAGGSLTGGFVFATENGLARLTLSSTERDKPFIVGFRRAPEREDAYLGNHAARLAEAGTPEIRTDDAILPALQLGGLESGDYDYGGWIGELYLYDRALSDDELYGLFEFLEEKYGVAP